MVEFMKSSIGWMARGLAGLLVCAAAGRTEAAGAETESTSAELESSLLSPGVWDLDAAAAGEAFARFGFKPLTEGDAANLRAVNLKESMFGMEPSEILVRMGGGSVGDITVMLYARGDRGPMSEKEFLAAVTGVRGKADAWAGGPGMPRRQESRTSRALVQGMTWVREPHRLDIEWSWSRGADVGGFRSEYLRATISRYDPAQRAQILSGGAAAPSSASTTALLTVPELKKRAEKRPNGDIVVAGVPMVDQGEKGYCAAATVERILRFYGHALDQHDIAQLANTSAEGGTSSDAMVGAMRRMTTAMKLRVVPLVDADSKTQMREPGLNVIFTLPKNMQETLKDYNRLAKKEKLSEIGIREMMEDGDATRTYARMKSELLREARLSRTIDKKKFQADIQRYVEAGVPLAWSLLVGIVPEEGTRGIGSLGGHMRIITGINPSTNEILYTDSWGAGHEEKRMAVDDAWVGTTGLYAILPGHLRI
jgi:hypothetical protein